MKLAVISALFASAAQAVKINDKPQVLMQAATAAEIEHSSTMRMQEKLKTMDMGDLTSAALDEAKKATAENKASNTESAVSKDAEMKAVEAALASRIMGRLAGQGYIPGLHPLAYPLLKPDVASAVGAINAIHGSIIAYEYANAIAGLVKPSVDAVSKVLEAVTDTSGMAKNSSASSSSAAPADSVKLQINAEGVPVLVNPVLMQNEVSDADLGMRNWVLDGVNGFDLVQLQDEPIETVSLMVHGVPVLVNPESELLTNEMASIRLNPCFDVNGNNVPCEIGPDEVNIAQLSDESITLQVKGVPVLVNPESELLTNEVASARLRPCETVNGDPRECTVGPDDIVVSQLDEAVTLQVKGVPVLVNPESEMLTNEVASSRLMPCVTVNGDPRECTVGPDDIVIPQLSHEQPEDITALQVNGVPVLVYPESELLTNEVAASRLNPCVDVNGNSRACSIGPDDVSIVQIEEKGVPVLVYPESELLTNEVAAARLNPCVDVNGNSRACSIGPDDVSILQTKESGVPVLVQPESELMSNTMASARLNPCLDVNGNARKCEVGPDDVTVMQVRGQQVTVMNA